MRLLITTDTIGGVWTYTKELSEGLLMQGHKILLISMGREPSPDQRGWEMRTRSKWAQNFQLLSTEYSLEWMQDNSGCYTAVEALLMKQIESWCPDVLHLNQFCYGALPTDIPKIVIAHSDVMSWHSACRGVLPDNSKWFRHYMKVVSRGLSQATTVVAPTRWMLDALCSHYCVPAHRIVISNGRSIPSTNAAQPKKMQAVTIGRVWDEGKNVRLLETVAAPMPLLVGGELSLESEPLFTSARLELLGQLSEKAAFALFAQSAVYIATSVYEPFGLAPLEAALSGCAIVANDIASLREVWGDSAYYFKSAEELSQILHSLHDDKDMLVRAGAKARRRARALFSREAMVASYVSLYKRLTPHLIVPAKQAASVQHVS